MKAEKGRILVLDDEPVLREVMEGLLRSLGYNALTFATTQELIAFLNENPAIGDDVAAIFLDLTLPGGEGGEQVATQIRQRFSSIPLIALSGLTEHRVMDNPTAHGFTASLQKPFRLKELVALLERAAIS